MYLGGHEAVASLDDDDCCIDICRIAQRRARISWHSSRQHKLLAIQCPQLGPKSSLHDLQHVKHTSHVDIFISCRRYFRQLVCELSVGCCITEYNLDRN